MKMKLCLSVYRRWKPIGLVLLAIFVVAGFTACSKKNIDPENRLSYQIGLKTYNYSFLSTPGLFGGSTWRSIEAISFVGGFYMYANYSSRSHNTLHISFANTVNDLPQAYYAIPDGQVFISMDNYKQKDDNFYIVDPRDKDAYIKFDHISPEYVEGSFEFTLVKSDRNNMAHIDPGKTIRLKKGKFRVKVN